MLPFLFSLKYHSNDKIFKSMNTNNFDSNEVTFQVDLNEATLAVKENRFSDALKILEIILKDNPDHIDSLYLAAVSSRYLKKFDESKKYIELLLLQTPDMGRAYQELGHINRDMGNEESSTNNYRQASDFESPRLFEISINFSAFKNRNAPFLPPVTSKAISVLAPDIWREAKAYCGSPGSPG